MSSVCPNAVNGVKRLRIRKYTPAPVTKPASGKPQRKDAVRAQNSAKASSQPPVRLAMASRPTAARRRPQAIISRARWKSKKPQALRGISMITSGL